MKVTKETLLAVIADGSLREYKYTNVECKRSWKQDNGKSISALCNRNTEGPSFLVIGVEDNGELSNHLESWMKSEEENISQHLNQYLDPAQTCLSIECKMLLDGAVIIMHLQNPGSVVKWNMKSYKGAGTTKEIMSPEEEMERVMSLPGMTDYSKRPWSGSYNEDLAISYLDRVIKHRQDVPFSEADIKRDHIKALSYIRLLGNNVTRILFGDVGYRLVMYDKKNNPSVNTTRHGLYSLVSDQMINEIQEWCKKQSNGSFKPFSEKALHEAIANAVAHAAYFEQDGDIIVEAYPNRVEVSNLCLPDAAYFANRWFSKSHKTFNALLMESLRLVAMVDELGRGKTMIYTESIKSGRKPPEVYIEGAGRLNRWRTIVYGGKRDRRQLNLINRLKDVYDSEGKVMIAAALVLWHDKPVQSLRQYIDGDSAPHFAEVLSDLKGPIFYYEKEDRIILNRWVTILLSEGKQSKALSQAEKEGLFKFAFQLQTQYNDGYITPKELRELTHMTNSRSEQVLSCNLLKEWQSEGKVVKIKQGTYRFVPGSVELMNLYQTILDQLKPINKEGNIT